MREHDCYAEAAEIARMDGIADEYREKLEAEKAKTAALLEACKKARRQTPFYLTELRDELLVVIAKVEEKK